MLSSLRRNAAKILRENRRLIAANGQLLSSFFNDKKEDFMFPLNSAGTTTFVKIRPEGPLARALTAMIARGHIKLDEEEDHFALENEAKSGRASENGTESGRGLASAFCAELLRRKNVLLLPAAEYDGYEDVYFRISLARKNMDGLKEIGDFLREIYFEFNAG